MSASIAATNTQIHLVSRPDPHVTSACFALREVDIRQPDDGEVLVRNLYLSCDPYMRGRMGSRLAEKAGYASGFALDEPIPARVVGQVSVSRHADFAPGDFVWGFMNWELVSLVKKPQTLFRIDATLGPISHAISVLGMPGKTAEVGMLDIGHVKAGDTVFVSAASGAVGSVAGQLARAAGARVVGSAGSDAKVAHIQQQLGFDAAFNYKTTPVGDALDVMCPDGIDVYFDNVGGATLEAVLTRLRPFARIPVCGMISQYDGADHGVRGLGNVVGQRAVMTGFIIYDHMADFAAFPARMAARMKDGVVRYFEDIVEGIENTPDAFMGMMRGENLGKRLVRVAPDPTCAPPGVTFA